jgi:MoxR-like ATPase
MICGYHGTGKSTHVEQVASRLNWPCIRVNLDSHISRIDLIGKDAIVLRDNKQVTEFREGLLPWALQHPVALCFDEYDAGRPDVMFVIQRVLEVDGKLTLLDQNRVIRPHQAFRLFSTANTVGLGDTSGLYHGTQQINQGQMDRWNIVTVLNYLDHDVEVGIVAAKAAGMDDLVLVEQGQLAFDLEHALDHEHHVRPPGIVFVEAQRDWMLQGPGQKTLAEFGDLLVVAQYDRVLAHEIDAADVAVEVDADAGPIEPRGDLLDMGRFAGAVVALDHHAAVEGEAGEDRQCRIAVETIGVVEIRDVLARLAERRDLQIAVDPEGLADRDRDVGLFQRKGRGGSRWLDGWHYSLLSQ